MKISMKLLAFGFCLVAFVGLPFVAQAQDEEADPPNMADLWIVHVEAGKSAAFEEAFKSHIAFRAENGDPRAWNTYTVAVGEDLGAYGIRFCCIDLADADSYDAWDAEAGAGEHWNANVDQYVDSYEHYYTTTDFENSNWPEGETNYSLFGVTRWVLKQGAFRQMNEAKGKMSSLAKEHGWPRYWSWQSQIGGSNVISIVSPYENYAGMEPPEQSFFEFLVEHMESPEAAGELLGSFSSSFKSSSYTVYRLRDDLSMSADEE